MESEVTWRKFWAFWLGLLICGDGLFLWIRWQNQPNLALLVGGIILLSLGGVSINYSGLLEYEGEMTP